MEWKQVISSKRLGQESRHTERHDERSEFKRDYDRLIFSAPFRRMQNKTQVFPLPGSIFVHNRLTHSLEVASVGMSLGSDVARALLSRRPELSATGLPEAGTIVSTACLAHDMGNPPFGHSGEKAIQAFFLEGAGQALRGQVSEALWSDMTHFEGNANAFRLLAHRFRGRREGGFVMTYATLASIVKYPRESLAAGGKGKFGFFRDDREIYLRIASDLGIPRVSSERGLSFARHPLVFLVEAADDICYEVMDLEDAHKLRILSYEEAAGLLLAFFDGPTQNHIRRRVADEGITDPNERITYLRACVIGRLENLAAEAFVSDEAAIMRGERTSPLIESLPDREREAYHRCQAVSSGRIYNSKPVLDIELSGYKIMATLMEQMTEAVVHPERFYSRQLIGRVSSQYDIQSPDLETRLLAVLDYISGMTDVYALDIYQKINGISLPIV